MSSWVIALTEGAIEAGSLVARELDDGPGSLVGRAMRVGRPSH